MTYFFRNCMIFLMSLLLSACFSWSPYNVNVTASDKINADRDFRSLPVEVRVYELTNPTAFESATFKQLWQHDGRILGKTLLDKQTFMVNPKTMSEVKLKHDENAKYIGVMAVFRNPRHNTWRIIRPIGDFGGLTIMVDGNRIFMQE